MKLGNNWGTAFVVATFIMVLLAWLVSTFVPHYEDTSVPTVEAQPPQAGKIITEIDLGNAKFYALQTGMSTYCYAIVSDASRHRNASGHPTSGGDVDLKC